MPQLSGNGEYGVVFSLQIDDVICKTQMSRADVTCKMQDWNNFTFYTNSALRVLKGFYYDLFLKDVEQVGW